jgi:flagellar FliL protein
MVAEKEEKIDEQKDVKEKKSLFKWVVLAGILILLVISGSIGWSLYTKKDVKKTAIAEAQSKKKKEVDPIVFPLRSFIVNLMDKRGIGKKYLKLTMELEVGAEEDKRRVEKHIPQLSDTILLLLSSQSVKEINTMEGKIELKQTLLARMNRILGKGSVHKIYFTEFVVQ